MNRQKTGKRPKHAKTLYKMLAVMGAVVVLAMALPMVALADVTTLTATEQSPTEILVEWPANPGADSYEVWFSLDEHGIYSLKETVSGTVCLHSGLQPGYTYFYKVYAFETNNSIAIETTGPVNATTPPMPPVIGGASLAAEGSSDTTTFLRWPYPSLAQYQVLVKYKVYRSSNGSNGQFDFVADVLAGVPYEDFTYTDTGRTPGTLYHYKVTPVDSYGREGTYSGAAPAVTWPSMRLSATPGAVGSATVNLSWNDWDDDASQLPGTVTGYLDSYTLQRATAQSGPYADIAANLPTTTTTYADTGVNPNVTYYYRIVANLAYGQTPVPLKADATVAAPAATTPPTPVTVKHTVTFDVNGGNGGNFTQQVNSGAAATRPADPTRPGYTFRGWNHGSAAYNFASAVTADITLVAQWRAVPATSQPETPALPPQTPPDAPGPELPVQTTPPVVQQVKGELQDVELATAGVDTDALGGGGIPLGGFTQGGVWSLLNLMCVLAGAIMALLEGLHVLMKRPRKKTEQSVTYDERGRYVLAEPEKVSATTLWTILLIGLGILNGIFFMVLENLNLVMALISPFTAIILPVFLGQVAFTVARVIATYREQRRTTRNRAVH